MRARRDGRRNIYLPDSMLGKLQAISAQKGIAVAELVRRAVDEWFEREARKARALAQPKAPDEPS